MCDQQSLRSACPYEQSDQSLCESLEYSMIVKLLTEHNLEFLSLKGGCTGSSESTLVKMPHCWKSHCSSFAFRQSRLFFFPVGFVYGAKENKKLRVFIDDVNLPVMDQFGVQRCNEVRISTAT